MQVSEGRNARNLHKLNNFNSSECQVHETCTGSINSIFTICYWEDSASGAEARKEIEKLKLWSLCRFRSLLPLENLTFPSSCRFPPFQASLDSWKGISVQNAIWDTQVHF